MVKCLSSVPLLSQLLHEASTLVSRYVIRLVTCLHCFLTVECDAVAVLDCANVPEMCYIVISCLITADYLMLAVYYVINRNETFS